MDELEPPTLFATGPDFALNVIEPELSPDVVIDRRGLAGGSLEEQSSYIAMLARRRREFDAARALMLEQAAEVSRGPARADAGTDAIRDQGGTLPVPKLTPLAETPERVRRRYLRAGSQYFLMDAPYRLAFEDRGRYLVTAHACADIVESMMDVVREKAWTCIRVSGYDAFCREIGLQAASIGIEVSRSIPNTVDRVPPSTQFGSPEHARVRMPERLAVRPHSQPQLATAATPRGVRVDEPEHSGNASARQSTSDDDAMQLAVIVAVMREQGFGERSVDRVKRRAERMLDAFHIDRVELPRPRVFDPLAPSTRAEWTEQKPSRPLPREIEHAPAMPVHDER
ncbi:MAG: hypothetical protein IOC39_15100 [Burkholderia sp.]|nr:hypothetical protein [Rhodocyclaceae bacterium]MCA3779134.1 hypothetical protein [Burkholderia sp.]MCA3797147.1 hypothetical protein [Burkholderia sp.]MCA3802871.1 hypothetical protein [Burkholderia sp.]MCA3812104.1 hypothetical protein [Burkholderia sp.]